MPCYITAFVGYHPKWQVVTSKRRARTRQRTQAGRDAERASLAGKCSEPTPKHGEALPGTPSKAREADAKRRRPQRCDAESRGRRSGSACRTASPARKGAGQSEDLASDDRRARRSEASRTDARRKTSSPARQRKQCADPIRVVGGAVEPPSASHKRPYLRAGLCRA